MKKYLKFLLIPIFALTILCGCGGDYSITDVKENYDNMKSTFVVDNVNNFFSDKDNPNAISIAYSYQLQQAINNINATNDVQKRYRALYYQQTILDYIFDFYNNYEEDFYRIAPSKDIEDEEVESLYNKISDLKSTLVEFSEHYDTFITGTESGTSDIMAFNIKSYSFYLNKVIDSSFNFINDFYNIYIKYCLENDSIYNIENIQMYVDKAYIDMSYIVYLENVKSFNYSVVENGICDLAEVVGSSSNYNLLSLLDNKRNISTFILENVALNDERGLQAKQKIDLFVYSRNVYNQRLSSYLNNYNNLDMLQINQYRFGINSSVSYESYLLSLSASEKSSHIMLDNFLNDTFRSYVNNLNSITM